MSLSGWTAPASPSPATAADARSGACIRCSPPRASSSPSGWSCPTGSASSPSPVQSVRAGVPLGWRVSSGRWRWSAKAARRSGSSITPPSSRLSRRRSASPAGSVSASSVRPGRNRRSAARSFPIIPPHRSALRLFRLRTLVRKGRRIVPAWRNLRLIKPASFTRLSCRIPSINQILRRSRQTV